MFHPIKHIKKVLNLYDDLICAQLVRNKSREALYRKCSIGEVCIDFVGMYDNKNVSYFYVFSDFPQSVPLDFKDKVRRECKLGVRASFFNVISPHKIEWNSSQMKSKLRILGAASEEQKSKDVNAYNLHANITSMNRQDYIEESLVYLSSADLQRGKSLVKMSMMMVISGVKGEDFDASVDSIEDYCKHIGITAKRVFYDIPDVLSYYSPFKQTRSYSKGASSIPTQIVTDEILARFNSYSQGILGQGGKRSAYFGTDIYSGFPILKVVKPKTVSPEVWLCTGETGSGKSFFIKSLLIQLLAFNMNMTVMDVEGTEYPALVDFYKNSGKALILNMGEGEGKYFDPVEISMKTGVDEIDRDARNLAINFTVALLRVLLGKSYYSNEWFKSVVNDIVNETYRRFGVTTDMETWYLSEGLTIFDVYDTLLLFHDCALLGGKEREELVQEYNLTLPDYISNIEYISALEKAEAFLSTYFSENGLRSDMFRERVMIEDIADADVVVCSFGMAGKSEHEIDDIQIALMQLSAAQISHQRSIYSNASGKFNVKVWEEFQRWGKFPDSDKTVGVAVTGGRKLGDVNIIITNVVKELLDDDRFGILSNKTSFFIGAIPDKAVRDDLAERLSIPNMKDELDAIATASRTDDDFKNSNSSSTTLYRHAFLVGLDSSKYGVVKSLVPRDLAESKLFNTGVTLKEDT